MHFCDVCQNMYYIRIDADNPNKLVYYCRKCGNESSNLNASDICVSKTYINQGEPTFTHVINKYTKLDPTLPRFNTILCPNPDCTTNTKDTPREIIYIRYDQINIDYIYLCSTCDTSWKTEKQG